MNNLQMCYKKRRDNENNENTGGSEDQIGRVEIDKKAPIAISGDNVYIVWFNDQNTPNNNSEVLFRSSNDGGITFADKINLSNTTTTDSINTEIVQMVIMSLSHGGNVIQLVKNQWSEQVQITEQRLDQY